MLLKVNIIFMKDYTEDANALAKKLGLSEPDWMRKIVVNIYKEAAKKVWADAMEEKGEKNDKRRKETSKN